MSRSQVFLFSLYLFYFVAVVNLLEQIIQTTWLDFATKPLLMPLLLIFKVMALLALAASLLLYWTLIQVWRQISPYQTLCLTLEMFQLEVMTI